MFFLAFLELFFFEDFFTGVFLGDNLTPRRGDPSNPRGAVIVSVSAFGSYSSGHRETELSVCDDFASASRN